MIESRQKVLLLGAAFGTGNMGVGALAAASVRILHTRFSSAAISLLDYSHTAEVHQVDVGNTTVPVETLNIRFSWKIFLPNNIALLMILAALCRIPGLRHPILARNRWLREINETHAAFAISGGDSFSDIYGLGRFFYITLPQLLVMLMGRPLVLLPQTIGPFTGRLPAALASRIIGAAARTYSRDADGVDVARQLASRSGGSARVRFCHDVAFVLEARRPSQVRMAGATWEELAGKEIVGINISGLLMMGGYDGRNMFSLKLDYREFIDSLVRRFCTIAGTAVVLVPHVFSQDSEGDQTACRDVYERHAQEFAGRIACIESVHDQHEIKHLIGHCGFFLGARMHACIAALSQGIPAIGVAYSRKFAGVLGSIGVGDLVVDPREGTLDEIMAAIEARFEDRHRIAARLGDTMPAVRRGVLSMLDDLA